MSRPNSFCIADTNLKRLTFLKYSLLKDWVILQVITHTIRHLASQLTEEKLANCEQYVS